ncbi:uncharacterized protein L203_101822 [Cryptococcus depauperatus CBS 7841]|uniref:Uncharacterized protein n=1 Tax=Cryptococcus depauperatus CBS 7841 TaxID=1295531 RepID=A0AAJ8M045_9TREE
MIHPGHEHHFDPEQSRSYFRPHQILSEPPSPMFIPRNDLDPPISICRRLSSPPRLVPYTEQDDQQSIPPFHLPSPLYRAQLWHDKDDKKVRMQTSAAKYKQTNFSNETRRVQLRNNPHSSGRPDSCSRGHAVHYRPSKPTQTLSDFAPNRCPSSYDPHMSSPRPTSHSPYMSPYQIGSSRSSRSPAARVHHSSVSQSRSLSPSHLGPPTFARPVSPTLPDQTMESPNTHTHTNFSLPSLSFSLPGSPTDASESLQLILANHREGQDQHGDVWDGDVGCEQWEHRDRNHCLMPPAKPRNRRPMTLSNVSQTPSTTESLTPQSPRSKFRFLRNLLFSPTSSLTSTAATNSATSSAPILVSGSYQTATNDLDIPASSLGNMNVFDVEKVYKSIREMKGVVRFDELEGVSWHNSLEEEEEEEEGKERMGLENCDVNGQGRQQPRDRPNANRRSTFPW